VLTKRPERAVEWFKWLEELVEDDAQRCVEFNLVNIHFARAQCAQLKCWELARDAIRSTGAAIDGSVWDAEMMSRETFRWPLPNVWLGVSVEHQDAAEERISHLLLAPAAIRFLSCEPLLGEIDLPMVQAFGAAPGVRIDWVIAGCESGPGARLCKVNWLRSLRDQCEDGGVPFFLQVGDVHPVVEGKRSTVKGNVIGAPYLDGEQWLMFPTPKEKTEHE
jgi:protein gp37